MFRNTVPVCELRAGMCHAAAGWGGWGRGGLPVAWLQSERWQPLCHVWQQLISADTHSVNMYSPQRSLSAANTHRACMMKLIHTLRRVIHDHTHTLARSEVEQRSGWCIIPSCRRLCDCNAEASVELDGAVGRLEGEGGHGMQGQS